MFLSRRGINRRNLQDVTTVMQNCFSHLSARRRGKVKYLIDLVTRVYARRPRVLKNFHEDQSTQKRGEKEDRGGGEEWKRMPVSEQHHAGRILRANFRMWRYPVLSWLVGPGKLSGNRTEHERLFGDFGSRSNDTPPSPKEFQRQLNGYG